MARRALPELPGEARASSTSLLLSGLWHAGRGGRLVAMAAAL
jgi:hypothetical protein